MSREAAKADFAQAVVEVEEAARLAVDTIRAERALADDLYAALAQFTPTDPKSRAALARYRQARQ